MYSAPLIWQLDKEGYKITYCQSIEDVLDEKGKLKVPLPDCILLDIMMPRGEKYSKIETESGKSTGLRLLEDLQKELPNTPVIINTIRNDLGSEEEVRKQYKTVRKILIKPNS